MEPVKASITRTIEIPAKWWPDGKEMVMNKIDSIIYIMPRSKAKEAMREGLDGFTEDLFEDGRPEQIATVREDDNML